MSLLRPQMGPFCLRSEALPSRLDLRNVATATSCTDRTAVCVVRSCLYIYYTDSPTRSTDSRRSSIQVRKCWQACHESAGSHESRGRVDTRRAGCVLEHRSVHYTQWGHYCALRRSPRPLRVIAPPTHRRLAISFHFRAIIFAASRPEFPATCHASGPVDAEGFLFTRNGPARTLHYT